MAVSNTTVKQLYVGDGSNDTFAIPFAFIPSGVSGMTKVFLIDTTLKTPVLQVEGAMQDYVLDPPYDPTTNPNGPTDVIFNTPPLATDRVLVIREIAYTQVVSFISNTAALGANNLELGLDRAVLMIQQLYEQLGRAPVIQQYDALVETFDPILPPAAADAILTVNATGDGFEFRTAAEVLASIPGGGGVPAGGAAGDFIEKLSATDGDAAWQTGSYDGFSARFGAIFTSTGLKDTLDKIIQITYTAPQISLSASGSGTVRERGDAVTATTLTATITRRSDPIAEVRFFQNPSTLLDTQTSGGAIPNGGSSTYSWTGSFSNNTTFRAEVQDDGATGGPTTVSATSTFNFVYPYYFGSGAAALSASGVAALTKDIRVSTSSLLRTFTPNGSQVLYFAYPASYGALTTILDENGFNTFPSWTLRTENITGLDATAQSYRIYEYNNTPVAGTYPFTFIR